MNRFELVLFEYYQNNEQLTASISSRFFCVFINTIWNVSMFYCRIIRKFDLYCRDAWKSTTFGIAFYDVECDKLERKENRAHSYTKTHSHTWETERDRQINNEFVHILLTERTCRDVYSHTSTGIYGLAYAGTVNLLNGWMDQWIEDRKRQSDRNERKNCS